MSDVGREIRRLREGKGWTQIELAFRSGLNPSSVNLIESGKRNPSAGSLTKIAGALGVEVGDLFPKDQIPLDLEGEREAAARRLLGEVEAGKLSAEEAMDALRAAGVLQPRQDAPEATPAPEGEGQKPRQPHTPSATMATSK